MKAKILLTLCVSLAPFSETLADQSVYCPQHTGYINVGMSVDQVVSACGQPMSKRQSNKPAMQKIPVQQLIYTTVDRGSVYPGLNSAFYNQWSIPSGTKGVEVQIDIVNNKVNGVKLNGSSSNAVSVCNGPVQVGDNASQAYNACGTPTMVNNTYIEQPIQSNSKAEVWLYQMNEYQQPVSLTFVNGKLQSIN